MDPGDDPYKILGVDRDADDATIKKAYRKAALQFHPDRQHTDEEKEKAHHMFSKISAAYEVVSDPVKRDEWEKSKKPERANSVGPMGGRRRPRRGSNAFSQDPSRTRSTNSPPQRQRSTHSPPPPSPGMWRSRPKRGERTGSPSKRDMSPVARPVHRRSLTEPRSPTSARPPMSAPQSPGALRRSYVGTAPQSPGALRPRSYVGAAPQSPGALGSRQRKSAAVPPQSPGSIRPGGRPRPRPVKPGGGPPRKNNSTGTLRRSSIGSLSARPGADGEKPRRQMSQGSIASRRKFRDPFLIFDEVMELEFGKGYKSKAASGWNKDEDGKNPLFGGEKKLSAKKEFKKLDLDGDEVLSKSELRNFIESNEELWAVLGTKLNLQRDTCIRIATEVAFNLAKGEETPKRRKSTVEVGTYELSEAEFKTFYKNYVMSQKGSYDFFLRTIFAFYDLNGDGVLQRDEFENFLDLFYKTKEAYKQKLNAMPSKQKLMRIAEARLDKSKTGELSFEEVRDLLQVAVVITE